MAYNMGGRRFRPVGSGKKRTAPQYGPVGTGCPFVEEAVARLYREQNEEHFWSLMNALNYALELQTRVLVPLDAAVDPQSGAAPWAHLPIPEDRAEGLPPWLLHARKERHYLPLFTSVKNAEAEKASATRPMVERSLRSAMEYALETDGIDGVVLDPWTSSATLDVSLLSGLLKSERGSDNPGAQELEAGHAAARAGDWPEAAARYTAAAEAGSAEALSALGDCLYYGRGARKNKTQARRMWKKAAQAGEVQAMIALGDHGLHRAGRWLRPCNTTAAPRALPGRCRTSPTPRRSACALPSTRPSISPAKRRCCRWRRPCRAFGSCRPRAKRMLPTGCGRLNC